MGSGILMDCYVQALLPLTDGLPPRSMESIIEIIEKDMNEVMKKNKNNNNPGGGGIKVSDLFLKIDPKPLGAASIAQVHKATLLDGMPF
jgi:predicted unusual protein kinase regulating ubiquinone biosynthesis (AarF/ABC1/UbiB family)